MIEIAALVRQEHGKEERLLFRYDTIEIQDLYIRKESTQRNFFQEVENGVARKVLAHALVPYAGIGAPYIR